MKPLKLNGKFHGTYHINHGQVIVIQITNCFLKLDDLYQLLVGFNYNLGKAVYTNVQ